MISGVGVIDKSMRILAALELGPASLAELTDATGFTRATTHRLASALAVHGLVRRLDDARFALGFRLMELGQTIASAIPIAEMAQPVLQELTRETGESSQLYLSDGEERVCVAVAESTHGLRTIVPVGRRLTMALGSAGRVLDGTTGPDGFIGSVEEREAGVASVSAPVIDERGRVAAAISVSGPLDRLTDDPAARYGHAVKRAAWRLEQAMGWRNA